MTFAHRDQRSKERLTWCNLAEINMRIVSQILEGAHDLSGIPELTFEAVEAARSNPAAGCLIDRVYPGHPLIISFAFRELQHLKGFDFFGRTKEARAPL